jgi:DNA-binding MarR family transcriptional regulator
MSLDDADGRLRIATLTKQGRKIHDDILGIALERERVLLSVLKPQEQEVLISLLTKLHENLHQVEVATTDYVKRNFKNKTKVSS